VGEWRVFVFEWQLAAKSVISSSDFGEVRGRVADLAL
jgi:hypothetical protein